MFKSLKGGELRTLDTYKPGCWVNIVNPDTAQLEQVAADLKLDLQTMKDALDPYEVSRIEREDGSDYIFVRTPVEAGRQVHTAPLLIVVTPDYFVTVSEQEQNIAAKIKKSPTDISTTQKTKLFIQLLLDINSDYSHRINEIRKKVRNFTLNMQNISNQDIIQLVNFESVFNDYLSSLEPLAITLGQLLSGKYLQLFEADQDLVEDLQIGTNQLVKLCLSNIKAMANIREAYTSIISNNLNRTVKLLTAVTLILTIPTAIASFFGMNVPLPLANHPAAFLAIILATLFITGVMWIVFWKKDYL